MLDWCVLYNWLSKHIGIRNKIRDGSEHMLARCSLGARSVLGLFYGARARGLKSEHMLVLARARG